MAAPTCTACGKAPSGLIRKPHDFCEHCGAPLPKPAPKPVQRGSL